MSRAADYTIQGFLYQFHKTLLEILESPDDSQITIEGIIEDIEVRNIIETRLIQCKYHEAQDNFTLSLIYKPLLQMMKHFNDSQNSSINYKLYAYFPNESVGIKVLTKDQLREATESDNQKLKPYTEALKGKVDFDKFLTYFSFEIGKSYDDLVDAVYQALENNGMPEDDLDTLIYPNAIQKIADVSIKHADNERRIKKSELLTELQDIKKTAITRWTLALKTRDKILETRKHQLQNNLGINTRSRYFIISDKTVENFNGEIVIFIDEYVNKYHHKPPHIEPPLFCLDCSEDLFNDICVRLRQKGIIAEDGFVGKGTFFDEAYFFRKPMIQRIDRIQIKREFCIRILHFASNGTILNDHKCDDLFVVNETDYTTLNKQDINVEKVAITNFQELKFILGIKNVYE